MATGACSAISLFSFIWWSAPSTASYYQEPTVQCSSGVTGRGAECPPETSDREILADISGKRRQGKKGKRGENWEEKKENCKRERGKLEMEVGKVIKRGEDFFFFFFFFFFFLLFTFENDWKFVLGLPKWEFSTGKKHFTPGKKSGKMTLPPQKNMPVMPLQCSRCRLETECSASKAWHPGMAQASLVFTCMYGSAGWYYL